MATSSFETFNDYAKLAGIDDTQVVRDIYDASVNLGYFADDVNPNDILDLLSVNNQIPESYKNFLSEYYKIKAVNPSITTVAEWGMARKQYKTLLSQYGLTDIADNASADNFLMNNVSASEAADRLNAAFSAVVNADDALKNQLREYYPSMNPVDIAKTMLGVGQSVAEISKKINVAGIKAEAATAGLQSTLNAEQLAAQGIDRAAARQGFQQTAQELSAYQGAAERAGQDVTTIQKELESENILGLASQRRKKLAEREANLFQGQSGVGTPSLNAAGAGSF